MKTLRHSETKKCSLKRSFFVFAGIFLIVSLSGCQKLDELRAAILGKIDDAKETVEEVKTGINEAKTSIENKVEDIKNAAREVKEAGTEVKEAVDAINQVTE